MKFKKFRDWDMLLKIMTIPVLIIICLLVMIIFRFLPFIEEKLINEKESAVKNAVQVVFTLIADYHSKVKSGELTENEAQKKAMRSVRMLRYKNDDYFWINDFHPIMLMHPEKPELEGEDLSGLKDARGKYLFKEFVSISMEKEEGFVDYLWPKPGSDEAVPKLSYVRPFKPWGWIVGSGIYIDDVKGEMKKIRFQIIFATIVLSLVVLISAYFIARMISHPLHKAVNMFNQIADGNLTVEVPPEDRNDEVGELMSAFGDMLLKLRNQTRHIMESTHTIAAAITQISSTATQFAASSSETSSSVSEISTTVEEVRQTAYLSNEKADLVAKGAEQVARISDEGKEATADSISGMNRIREDMEYVAESIVKLSEQTQSIGEIISAVDDLADQSNLLSVNASIEAAKAGEHGKGFAVVAQEVKSLANQSKAATNQVKNILNDIQKATSTAVMATERGTKAVEAGVYLSGQSGHSIDMLTHSITGSAQAAIQIAASSQEQLVGMDQLAEAMENIKEASMQNAQGAKQLEIASKNLNELGQSLRELASMFKV